MPTYKFIGTNISFNLSEQLYFKLGSSVEIDILYLLSSVIAFISLLLNLINLITFAKINIPGFKIYHYLRCYSLNSAIISLILTLQFIGYSPRLFIYFAEYFARIYRCRVQNFVNSILYMTMNLLDIIIAFDRLSIFIQSLRRILIVINPYKTFIVLLLLSLIANLPVYFNYDIRNDEDFAQTVANNLSTFVYCKRTSFYQQQIKFPLITYVSIFFRDVFTFTLEVNVF